MIEMFSGYAADATAIFHSNGTWWFGAAGLCFVAAAILIFAPVVRNLPAGVLCIVVGIAMLFVGGLYAQRDVARAEAKRNAEERDRIDANFTKYRGEVKEARDKQEREAREKEKHDADAIAKQVNGLNREIAALRADRERLAQRVLDAQRAQRTAEGGGKLPGVPGAPAGTRPPEPAGVPVDYRQAFEQLTVDAAETAKLFAKCRDSWKAVAVPQ